MTANEIMVILDRHKKWLKGEEGGSRANLRNADLSCANLFNANLRNADLHGADLRCANLRNADLSCADLYGADLRRANLLNADLSCANLSCANLRNADLSCANLFNANLRNADLYGADLYGADLSCADLYGADLRRANLLNADLSCANLRNADLYGADLSCAKNLPDMSFTSIVPETGAFVGWKKVRKAGDDAYIVKLEILANAKRSNATGRKCRCSAAKVLEIQTLDGKTAEITSIANTAYNPAVTYTVGEVVYPDSFDDDRWNECSHGIHFFVTRKEAVDY